MSFIRSALTLCALALGASATMAQGTTPAVSTVVAFSFSNPAGNIIRGADGALYGAASSATSAAGGIVYRTTADGSSVSTIYQLDGRNDGISPQAGLTLGSDGMLYGTTKFGRVGELTSTGTVFKVSQTGTGFTVLHRFAAYTTSNENLSPQNTDGAFPEAELVQGSDTYLYGVTTAGGPNGTGAVFKVSRDGSDFKLLHAFGPDTDNTNSGLIVTVDGAAPLGQLVQGANGYLYGTTSVGGTFGRGTIFRVNFDGTGFEVLKHFPATTPDATTGLLENEDGALPVAGLIDGNDGFFYGVTSIGGTTGQGVVFAIAADGSTYTVLHHFDGATGQRPAAELLLGADGKLYGVASAGGVTSSGGASSLGTIFSIDRSGTNVARLHSFDGSVGSSPSSRLVQLGSTIFAGTVQNGGKCGYGAIFRYSGAGDTVSGNTRCGRSKNDDPYGGGGSGGPALLLLLGTFIWLRRRTA
jgi:uncharacterized repeat protein (TIGR03803 family)